MPVLQLFVLVVSLTAVSFGGGQTLLAGLERELVHTGVITAADYATAVALGQATPGPIAAFTTAIGRAAAGLPGAIVATLALVAVSLLSVLLIARVPSAWFRLRAVRGGLGSVAPFAAAVVWFLAWRIAVAGEMSVWPGPAAIVAGVAVGRLMKVPTAILMLGAVALGMALQGTPLVGW